MKSSSFVWTNELERLLARELVAEYRHLDETFFKGALKPPSIALVETTSRLGAWIVRTRTIEISRPLVLARPWGAVIEVLKHEMAHQYVNEVLGVMDETAHGPAFRSICERLGIDAAASGMPTGETENAIVSKVAKLLALAESPNQHEAEAAMAAAQKLMLKHNIEHQTHSTYGFRQLGEPGRTEESQRMLSTILANHFFVEVVWVPVYRPLEGKRGSVLEVCGSPENLAMAEHVFEFLNATAKRLFEESDLPKRERRNFLAGVMAGFNLKLVQQAKKHQEEGLVWVGDADLERFYKARHPNLRWLRYGPTYRTRAFERGHEEGRKIVLQRPVRQGPSGERKLLTGK